MMMTEETRDRWLDVVDRIWIPGMLCVLTVGTYSNLTRQPITPTIIWQTVAGWFVYFMLWRIVLALKRQLRQGERAFDYLKHLKEERLEQSIGLRKAGDALAMTLEIILSELAQNTNLTKQSVDANVSTAALAVKTADELAEAVTRERAALAEALKVEHNKAEQTRHAILQAVDNVHDTAKASFKEANDVNNKIKDLNERLLHEEQKPEPQLTVAEASLQRIDEHTAATEAHTATMAAGLQAIQDAAETAVDVPATKDPKKKR